ncbi:MAG TPA: 3'-5' exonuclease [Thermomicrobiales bacterium]|nr:3'-5' exonuclease [Chloroflexota bacterium]HQX63555.1 3'-5' exonuclease [Thermomicrobiales bacterium]HBY47108.1 3'-5' exonuclease [Chloroflexota bacterium]HCG28699.1 3'-5' exonuclease [Chloroflexota bacterium]HQZ90874.1 3'-5' exonuclease [Thermomicrobiales bacterium]
MPPFFAPDRSEPSEARRRAARSGAVAWAATILRQPDVVFLDTETTGLDDRAEIVEIAVIDVSGRILLDSLVRPERGIPADAARIHGIDDTMVATAPRWRDVHQQLQPLLAGRTVVVYNADFDRRLVGQMNHHAGLKPPGGNWQCAMLQYAQFAAQWNERYGNYRWHRLEIAATRFGLPAGGHRARADALACRAVVIGMASDA